MKKGDLVYHEMWGNGMIVQQQGVGVKWSGNRYLVRFMSPIPSIGGNDLTPQRRFCWECDLEVISGSR